MTAADAEPELTGEEADAAPPEARVEEATENNTDSSNRACVYYRLEG